MVYTRVTVKNRAEAIRKARAIRKAVYNNKYTVTDIVYQKGSRTKNYEGKKVKRYGIVLRRKK